MSFTEQMIEPGLASLAPMPDGRRKTISIMTPCFNEEAGIAECYRRVCEVMETKLLRYNHEHLFIDNSSSDRTVAILKEIAAKDKRVKIIVNTRNFGPTSSPYYAILHTTGDAVVPLVADLQMPPELIVEFVRQWEAGYKMVIAVRKGNTEGWLMRTARFSYYRVIARLSNVEQIKNFIGFGLFDRQVVDVLRRLDDPTPYFRGLVSEIGFDKAFVYYDQPPRKHGKSKHHLLDLFDISMLALTTYSRTPIRVMTFTGLTIGSLSLLVGLVYFVLKLIFWKSFPIGIAPLIIATFFFGSVQLLALGLIGEYIGLIMRYVRRFPLVIERERVNFD